MEEIKHLKGRAPERALRVGKIARGYKTEVVDDKGRPKMRKGKPVTRPVATDYFIFKEDVPGAAADVIDVLGEPQPKTLPIRFLDNLPEQVFSQACELFRGDRLMGCKGTGGTKDDPGIVLYRRALRKENGKTIDETPIKKASVPYLPEPDAQEAVAVYGEVWAKEYGTAEIAEGQNTVVCLGEDCPKYSIKGCRPTGHLLFTIKGAERSGHWELVVHQLAILGFNHQLGRVLNFIEPYVGRRLSLVPFVISMGPEQRFKDSDGRYITFWEPLLEVDPKWFRGVIGGQITLPTVRRISAEDIWDREEVPMLPAEAAPTPPEDEVIDYDPGLPEDDWPHDEYPEGPPEEQGLVVRADEFRRWIVGKVRGTGNRLASKKQVGYAASMLGAVFGEGDQADVARHQFLEYTFGVKSTKELTAQQAHELIDWLKGDEGRSANGAYVPSPAVEQQATQVLRAWGEEHGQQRLPV